MGASAHRLVDLHADSAFGDVPDHASLAVVPLEGHTLCVGEGASHGQAVSRQQPQQADTTLDSYHTPKDPALQQLQRANNGAV